MSLICVINFTQVTKVDFDVKKPEALNQKKATGIAAMFGNKKDTKVAEKKVNSYLPVWKTILFCCIRECVCVCVEAGFFM